MNKGNLNKLVTNYPVELTEEEISNLSGTLAPVIAACGGGGGGTGGKIYTGIGFVTVNNTTNQIGLTNEANTKLNQDIPTKVSDLSDSANYQTVAGMDEYLTTAKAQTLYQTKDSMSAYLTTANAASTYQTKDAMSAYWTSAETNAAFEEELSTLVDLINGKQNKLTFAYDNDKISAINGSALAGQGGTTYTPGQYIDITNDEISVTGVVAIDKTSAYDPILLGDANITAVSSRVNNRTTWNLSVNATPVVTDTKLTGDNCVTAHTTETSGEWAVGLVQSAYQAIDSVGGIATDVGTLKTASAGWNAKVDQSDLNDYLTKTQYGTDSATFALKTETSSKTEITNALNSKVDKPTSIQTGKLVYDGDTSAWVTLPAGTTTIVKGQGSVTANYDSSNSTYTVSLLASAENALTAVDGKVSKPEPKQQQGSYVVWDRGPGQQWSDFGVAANNWANNFLFDEDYPIVVGNNGLSAGLVPGEFNDVYNVGLTQTAYNSVTSVSSKLDTTAFSNVSSTFLTKSSADNDYAPKSITATVNTLTAASAGWNNKVDKPTSLANKYLVLRTDSNGDVSGWSDLQEQCYSKTEATGTFVHRSMLDNDTGGTLSGTGLTGGSILGVNTNVIQTKLTNEQLSAISSVSGKQDTLTQAQLSAISSVSSKLDTSALTINTATNDITLATGPSTSASISAVNYKRNYSEALLVPQRIVVATSDDDIVQHINYYSDGQYGTIIFVTSAHTY